MSGSGKGSIESKLAIEGLTEAEIQQLAQSYNQLDKQGQYSVSHWNEVQHSWFLGMGGA